LRYLDEAEDVARRNSFSRLLFDIESERGTVYIFKADIENARRHCNEALKLAEESKITLDIMRAHLLMANFFSQFHLIDELSWAKSAEHLSKAENFFENGRYQQDLMILLSIRRRDLTAQGKPNEALKIARRLEKEATRAEDNLTLARAKKDIGTNLALLDQLPEAMKVLYESYSVYNSLNKPLEAGYSLLAYGDAALQMGDFEKARSTLEIAKGIAQEATKWLPPRVDLFEARILTAEQEFEDMIVLARRMIAEDKSTQMPSTFEARAMLALALTHTGRKSEGLREIQSLFSNKLPGRDDPEAAVALYLLYSEVLLENGKTEKAEKQAVLALDILKTLNKPSMEWKAYVLQSRAQDQLGNAGESKRLAAKADMLFSGLSEKWGKKTFENYSSSQTTQHFRNAPRGW
ncbi:MAG: hypothetical protein HKN33_04240, partial [Pyrinomonadaceae bacterium]|nr:hypothetical protein [Pyrinomonadaceae bacterium]